MIFKWQVTNLFTIDKGVDTNYVVSASYDVKGTKQSGGKEYTATLTNLVKFKVVQGNAFIPYKDLTNDLVTSWIQSTLGQDGVNNLQASVAGIINSQINPPVTPQNKELPPNF